MRYVALLALIGGIAIALAVASYQYSLAVSDQIRQVAAADIRSNTEIQAHDLSKILVNKVEAINNNLRVVSNSPVFLDPNQLETAKVVLSATQDTTQALTEFYMWIDQDGRMVWLSDITPEQLAQYREVDLSQREYFVEPRETRSIYYSTAILSNDGIPRVYISSPVIDADGEFRGVISAGIRLEVLGKYLESQLAPNFESSVGMMDRDGVILYTTDLSIIGTNVFDEGFQSRLPEGLREPFNAFLRRSLSGGSGAEDLSFEGASGTLAYQTVSIEGKDFAVLYATSQHTLTGSVISLIDQQRNFSTVVILAVGAMAVGMAVLVLSWNKRLQAVVDAKTRDLKDAVTSLQASNERLMDHDKIQTEFINIAAHELRTPVQPLLGIAEQLEEDLGNGVEEIRITRPEIEILARNANRLAHLTSDILEVSRIESRSMKLKKEKIDLRQKIQAVIEETKPFIREGQDLKIVFEPSFEGLAVVDADKSRLFEVLSNLLRNSIKFTEEGVITVRLDKTDGHAVISVSDTGQGIDPDIFPRLFTKFATKADTGTGLGLYISKSIVEAHGGRIWAENRPNGKGAIFSFTLPMEEAQNQKLQEVDSYEGKKD